MAACLFLGHSMGLIWGAVLFQAASIFDGVDGEIARATFRTSAKGAMLDSVTDAATNLAFIAGLTINLGIQGRHIAAAAGAEGLAMLTLGLILIGRRAHLRGGPFTFDAVKDHFRAKPSRIMQVLTWITMRDFFAAAGAVSILLGLASETLIIFAIAATIWLAITLSVLLRTHKRTSVSENVLHE
jgi:CDP-L-myo-inositol myo-inositolphosphotransferase